jgi:hypothetical protein
MLSSARRTLPDLIDERIEIRLVQYPRARQLLAEGNEGLARERNGVGLPRFQQLEQLIARFHQPEGDILEGFRCCASSGRAVHAIDAHARLVRVRKRLDRGIRSHEVCALQHDVRGAEIDELLTLRIDRDERDIPAVVRSSLGQRA